MSDIQPPDPIGTPNTQKNAAPNERWEAVLTLILLAVVVGCAYNQSIFFGKAYYWGDIGLFFLPLSQFLKESLASGQIPLWNPYLFCGAPFVGNPQVSVFYPSTLFLPLFPTVTAIMICEAAHIFAAGAFFWVFARYASLRLPYLPAMFAAFIYMLSGYFVAKAQFPNMLAALAYVPLLLFCTERLVLVPSIRSSIFFGTALGLQLLAAHTQITVFSLYLMIAYGIWLFAQSPSTVRFVKVLSLALLGGAVAAGLSCVYWLPTAQLILSSARQALTLHVANRFYLPWYELGNFVLPHLYGSPLRGDWHAHGNYWETDNYVGVLPFFFAIYGIFSCLQRAAGDESRRKQTCFWLAFLVISTWLSLGSEGGLYRIAFVVLPALKAFHDPARLMLGTCIAIALYGGSGLEHVMRLLRPTSRQLVAAVVIALSVGDLGWHDHTIYPLKPVAQIEAMRDADVPQFLHAKLASPGSGRIMMPDSQRAWQSFTSYRAYEQNDSQFMDQWPDTLSPCLGMTYGIREVGGYDPEYRRDSQELVSIAQALIVPPPGKHTASRLQPSSQFSPYLATLGVQFLVTYRVDSLKVERMPLVDRPSWTRHRRVVRVYENLSYSGRAREYTGWSTASNQNAAYAELYGELSGRAPFSLSSSPIIEHLPPSAGVGRAFPVEFLSDGADRVDVLAPAVRGPSVVVLADTLHPGWIAAVDGHPVPLLRANVDQRAVLLPASKTPTPHRVSFIYHPVDFLFGLYVSLVTILATLAIVIGSRPAEGGATRESRTEMAYNDNRFASR